MSPWATIPSEGEERCMTRIASWAPIVGPAPLLWWRMSMMRTCKLPIARTGGGAFDDAGCKVADVANEGGGFFAVRGLVKLVAVREPPSYSEPYKRVVIDH